jgi:hypothetical protein
MGWPLTAAAVLATFLLVRWAQKHDIDDQDVVETPADGPGSPIVPDQPDGITGQAPPAR